jgi:branched-chain amino acid transport system substrate-binding protein
MKKLIIILILAVIVILLIALSGTSKTSSPTSKEPVKIGAALMLTGPAALLGELQKNAINLAVEKINADGGINGRPVEVTMEDAVYDPKQAVNAYQALKQRGLKNFIIDGSPIIAATHQLVVDDGNFSIAAVATAPSYSDGSNRTCRIAITAQILGPAMSAMVVKSNYKKVAMLMPDNEYGRGLTEAFTKAYAAAGGTVVASEFFTGTSGVTDFRTSITKVKSIQSEVDAIIVINAFNTVESMLKQMKDLGITKQLVSDYSMMTNPALKDMSLVEGVKFINYEYDKLDVPSDSAETKAFKAAYRAKYNSDPIYLAAGHYDVTILLAKAIGAVGEDPQKMAPCTHYICFTVARKARNKKRERKRITFQCLSETKKEKQ